MVEPVGGEESYVVAALRAFTGFGDRPALLADGGTHYTYAQLVDRIAAMAAMLRDRGFGPGHTVAALVTTSSESVALQFAGHLIGCRTAWIAPNAPPPFRRTFLERSQAQAFVYEPDRFPAIGPRMVDDAGRGSDLPVFGLGPGSELGPDLAAAPSRPGDPLELFAAERPRSLFQTGGTTGEPKIILHGDGFFGSLGARAAEVAAADEPPLRHLLVAGTWHVSSQLAYFLTLLTGGTLLTQPGVDNGAFLRLIEAEQVTSTLLTPALLYRLLDDPRLADADCSSLRTLTVSGSGASPARMAQAIERFGPVLRVTYGLSEAPFLTAYPTISLDRPDRLASCGLPFADAVIEIRDSTGGPVARRQPGEVWARASLVMDSYWQQPELTAEALDGRWLRTGDIGYLDDDGYLFLVDRAKDMVVTGQGSTNVYCRPVEDALLSHPAVRAAAVFGLPDQQVGEVVHAVVVAEPDVDVTGEQLIAHVVAALNLVWAPTGVSFVDSLPLTEFGKVDKVALRAHYRTSAEPSAHSSEAAGGASRPSLGGG